MSKDASAPKSREATVKLFISYGRQDACELAFRLAGTLEARGFGVWLDRSAIRAGAEWEGQIERGILECDTVVALLSPHAVRRPDGVCLDEISFARYNGRRIVPVMVLDCRPPLGIYRLDWCDFRGVGGDGADYEQAVKRIVSAIELAAPSVEGTYASVFGALEPMDFSQDLVWLTREFFGRSWLKKELDSWLTTTKRRLFLLTGDPGAGKSAFLAHLVERHPAVAAYHFCLSTDAETLDPRRFVSSIAAQLATQVPSYGEALAREDLEGIAAMDPGTLFRRLILKPLRYTSPATPVVVVVDGLDEALRAAKNSIPRLMRDHLEALPEHVRIVASTRIEPEILDMLSRYEPHEINAGSPENLADVDAYIEERLSSPSLSDLLAGHGLCKDAVAELLAKKAAGNFLYLNQTLAGIESGQLDPRVPDQFPDGLVGLYQQFFERLFPESGDYSPFRPILDVLCAAIEPLRLEQIAAFVGRSSFDVAAQLERVSAFFPERGDTYRPYHKSIVDWLTGLAGRSRKYRVDLSGGDRRIADRLLEAFTSGDRSRFTLANLPKHLRRSDRTFELDRLLTNVGFVLAKCRLNLLQDLIEDYALLGNPELDTVPEALRLSAHVLTDDPGHIAGQLLGRLPVTVSPRLESFAEELRHAPTEVWLRPTTPSLTPAGGPLVRTLTGHSEWVWHVALGTLADGTPVVASVSRGGVRVENPRSGALLWEFTEACGTAVAVADLDDGRPVLITARENRLSFRDLGSGRLLPCPISEVEGTIRTLAFGVFGGKQIIATAGGSPSEPTYIEGSWTMQESKACQINLWDARTGAPLGRPMVGHLEPVEALALLDLGGGQLLVASSCKWPRRDEPPLRLWDAFSGRAVECRGFFGSEVMALSAGKLADGTPVLAIGNSFGWLTVGRVRPIGSSVYLDGPTFKVHGDDVTALCFAEIASAHVLVSGSGNMGSREVDCTVRLWDLERNLPLGAPLRGHTKRVLSVDFKSMQDGSSILVSGSSDESVRVWDPVAALPGHEVQPEHTYSVVSLALDRSPRGPVLVSGGWDSTVRLWDLASGRQLGDPLVEQDLWIGAVAVGCLRDGTRIAVAAIGGKDGTLRMYDLATRKALPGDLVGHTDWVKDLRFAHLRGTPVVVSASSDGTIRIWNLEARTEYRPSILHDPTKKGLYDWVMAIEVGELEGQPVVISGGQNGEARIWNTATGELLQSLRGHTSPMKEISYGTVTAVALANIDGQCVAITGGNDHTVRLWDPVSGHPLGEPFLGHKGNVTFVSARRVADRWMLISASEDHSVRIWEIATHQQRTMFAADSPIQSCLLVPDAPTLVAGTRSGKLHFLTIDPGRA